MGAPTALRQSDLAGALALVGEANASATIEEFPRRVVSLLRTLLRGDIASYMRTDAAGGAPALVFDPDFARPSAQGAELAAYAAQHPLVAHYARSRETRARRVSDFLTLREFQRLDVYDALFRPHGIKYQLCAPLVFDGPLPSGFGVTRLRSDFSDRERELLDVIRPHLASAYRRVAARIEADRRLRALARGLEDAGRAVVLVRGDRLEPQSDAAAELVRRWLGPKTPPLPPPGESNVVERDCMRLRIRFVDGDPSLLLLDETRFAPDQEAARRLGLTRREAEIVALAARGLTDASIAQQLFVSVRTVEKHLEHAYRKLGVASRGEAIALLLRH